MNNKIRNLSLVTLGLALFFSGYVNAQNADFDQGIDAKTLLVQLKQSARMVSASPQGNEEIVERCRSRDYYCRRTLWGTAAEVTEKLRKVNELYLIRKIEGCKSTGCIVIYIDSELRTNRSTVYREVVEEKYGLDARNRIGELKEQGYTAIENCESTDGRWTVIDYWVEDNVPWVE